MEPLFFQVMLQFFMGLDRPATRIYTSRMLERRLKDVGLRMHSLPIRFGRQDSPIFLENGGTLEAAQRIAGHESPRTTKLHDRTKDEITLSEVERIRL
jgi:integrase/recombinase XerD